MKAATHIWGYHFFGLSVLEWLSKQICSSDYTKRILKRLTNDIFPWLAKQPITEITASKLLNVVRKIK